VTPLERLRERARSRPARIVLPEAELDGRILLAACRARELGVALPVLLGDPGTLAQKAKALGLGSGALHGLTIIDHRCEAVHARLARHWRAHRAPREAISDDEARTAVTAPLLAGALLVAMDAVDGMTAGVCHPTKEVIRAALRAIGLRPSIATVSSIFIMQLADPSIGDEGCLVFADCAVVPEPDASQLADIAISSAQSLHALLGCQGRIAMLSFSTAGSAEHARVATVREATALVRKRAPQLQVAGELQLDAALVPAVAALKDPRGTLNGNANILVFPDLNSGNIGYKLVERLAHARAIGPILQGLAKPVNDLSRGAALDDVVDAIAITSLQASAAQTAPQLAAVGAGSQE
jgi:phosphate acetyltransferase